MSPQNKIEKNIDKEFLTDYDLVELYIRCVEVFTERCTAQELQSNRPFDLGQILWEKAVEARDKYRKGYPDKEAKR